MPIFERHLHIQQHQIRQLLKSDGQRLSPVSRFQHGISRMFEQRAYQFAAGVSVFGYKDSLHLLCLSTNDANGSV